MHAIFKDLESCVKFHWSSFYSMSIILQSWQLQRITVVKSACTDGDKLFIILFMNTTH